MINKFLYDSPSLGNSIWKKNVLKLCVLRALRSNLNIRFDKSV